MKVIVDFHMLGDEDALETAYNAFQDSFPEFEDDEIDDDDFDFWEHWEDGELAFGFTYSPDNPEEYYRVMETLAKKYDLEYFNCGIYSEDISDKYGIRVYFEEDGTISKFKLVKEHFNALSEGEDGESYIFNGEEYEGEDLPENLIDDMIDHFYGEEIGDI